MTLRLQPVHVATGSSDAESQLVFADGFLVAVLVRLSDRLIQAALNHNAVGNILLPQPTFAAFALAAERNVFVSAQRNLNTFIEIASIYIRVFQHLGGDTKDFLSFDWRTDTEQRHKQHLCVRSRVIA
jgi:hypothetical protein